MEEQFTHVLKGRDHGQQHLYPTPPFTLSYRARHWRYSSATGGNGISNVAIPRKLRTELQLASTQLAFETDFCHCLPLLRGDGSQCLGHPGSLGVGLSDSGAQNRNLVS